MPTCPICAQNYKNLDASESVCKKHENWIVTRCSVCHGFSFSDCRGFCMEHGLVENQFNPAGKPDPTYYLKQIGQEGQPTSGM
jgi:hypothetical protein